MEGGSKIDHTALDHGFFQFTLPHTWTGIIFWGLAAFILLFSGVLVIISMSIPDVPPISDATIISSLDEINDEDSVELGVGWENQGATANFAVIEVEIVEGTLVHGYWEYDADGENCTDYVDVYEDPLTLQTLNGEETFVMGWSNEMGTEVSTISRSCSNRYDDWFVQEGDIIEIFLMKYNENYSILSVGAEGLEPGERTEREDAQRFALLGIIIASLIMMITTPTSLSDDIKKLRTRWNNLPFVDSPPFVDGKRYSLKAGVGPIRPVDDNDWVIPPPGFETWPENLYEQQEDGAMIEEHPLVIGTPTPATFTLYSINGIIFIATSLWLVSDLIARHSDDFQILLGQILRVVVIIFNLIWLIFAWRKWKLTHNIIDTPTSKVRGVAVGPAELVGQVRPGPDGTLTVDVGGNSNRRVEGIVSFRWKEEEYVCTKDSDGKESCSWNTRRDIDGNTRFILHDGSGGILVEPSSWKKPFHGSPLHIWEAGRWRWTIWALGAGDPIYCLGRVETRTSAEKEEGLDTSIPNANLIVRGNKDIGMQVHLKRGTELSVISGLRSTTEAIIAPLVMLTFSAIPFLW